MKLNQIEEQCEGYINTVWGDKEISNMQKNDLRMTFYAGMLVSFQMVGALDDNEEVAMVQLDKLQQQIEEKVKGFLNVQ